MPISPNQPNTSDVPQGPTEWDNLATPTETANPSSTPNEYGLSPEDEARLAEVGLSAADLSPFPPSSQPQGNEKEKPVTAENNTPTPNTSAPNENNLSDGGLSDPGFGDF